MIFRQALTDGMSQPFHRGNRLRFRIGDGPIMTVSAFDDGHDYAELAYSVNRTVRRLGIVARALVLVDDAGRKEADDASE